MKRLRYVNKTSMKNPKVKSKNYFIYTYLLASDHELLLCQAFVVMKCKNMLPPFPDVVELCLASCFDEYEHIACLLGVFPKLDRLFLQTEKRCKRKWHGKYEAHLPNSFLNELRTIMITWDEGEDSVFPLLEILMKHARGLERMVLRIEKASSA